MQKYLKLLFLLFCFSNARTLVAQCPNYDAVKVMNFARRNTAPNELALISAHRGIWEFALENTVSAVDAAIKNCIEISEVDVRLTSDGLPAMIHDWYIQRSTSGTGLVYDKTFAEWTALFLRDRFGNVTNQHAPRFEEFWEYMKGKPDLVLVLDCKDTLSVGPPSSPNLKTSADVLAETYKRIKAYEMSNGLDSSLRDRIVFKMRFPEMGEQPNDLLHKLGITNCDGNHTRACTHLNVTPIWYAADDTKYPGFHDWKERYLTLAKTSDSWIWYPEVVVKYPNDGLQTESEPSATAGLTVTAFAANSDWAEGTSMGSGQCCSNRNYNMPLDMSTANFTGDYEYYVGLQSYGWISSDKAIDANSYLKARNKRNVSYITH